MEESPVSWVEPCASRRRDPGPDNVAGLQTPASLQTSSAKGYPGSKDDYLFTEDSLAQYLDP